MTILTNYTPAASYPDLLTTTNNGNGLTATLELVQDGLGHSSPMQIATNAVNFSRAGSTFQLDGVPLTATAAELNTLAGGATTGDFTVNGTLTTLGAVTYECANYTPPVNTSINVLSTDYLVTIGTAFTMDGQSISVVLPDAAFQLFGRVIYVKDISGTLTAARTIVVTVTGGGNIDGAVNYTLEVPYEGVGFFTNGFNWYTLSSN